MLEPTLVTTPKTTSKAIGEEGGEDTEMWKTYPLFHPTCQFNEHLDIMK